MTILGVDTSARSCSVAVVSRSGLLAEITLDNDQTHANHLMPMIDQVLSLAGASLSDLEGLAVTRGPGSFTGLRIGLSTVKGIGAATGKPIVAVSSLETLAAQVPPVNMTIVSLINAFRDEVYMAAYRYENQQFKQLTEETLIAPEKIANLIEPPAIIVGNGVTAYGPLLAPLAAEGPCFAPKGSHTIRASTVASIGLERLKIEGKSAAAITPVYLRKSDAEINRR